MDLFLIEIFKFLLTLQLSWKEQFSYKCLIFKLITLPQIISNIFEKRGVSFLLFISHNNLFVAWHNKRWQRKLAAVLRRLRCALEISFCRRANDSPLKVFPNKRGALNKAPKAAASRAAIKALLMSLTSKTHGCDARCLSATAKKVAAAAQNQRFHRAHNGE
jgi:hypothetical protein